MTFEEILDQAMAMLQRRGRLTYRTLQLQFQLDDAYLEALVARGLRFSGFDDSGQVRIVELPGHPFFLATLFQPELAGDGTRPHPLIAAFAAAAVDRATMATANA